MGTTTRLGVAKVPATFRLDARGGGPPSGHTVMNVGCVALTAVTLRTTAVAFSGMPATSVTLTERTPCGPSGALVIGGAWRHDPVPVRVSSNRHGPPGV